MSNQFMQTSPPDAYHVAVVADGTTTRVTIEAMGQFGEMHEIAYGESKRRKGDARNPALGQLLAFRRAFAQLLADVDEKIKTHGYQEPKNKKQADAWRNKPSETA